MVKLHAALFMNDHVGSTFEGIVSHVTKFGMFVELIDYFVEGLVSLESLGKDFSFDEAGMTLVSRRE